MSTQFHCLQGPFSIANTFSFDIKDLTLSQLQELADMQSTPIYVGPPFWGEPDDSFDWPEQPEPPLFSLPPYPVTQQMELSQLKSESTDGPFDAEHNEGSLPQLSSPPPQRKNSKGNNPYGSRGRESCENCRRRKGKVQLQTFCFTNIVSANTSTLRKDAVFV
jgi:hypothetical protein